MKDATASHRLQVIVLRALLLCVAIPWLGEPGWAGSATTISGATSSTGFVPPALSYSSVFKNYHSYREEAVASWPETNSTVGRTGGWRAYLEEAAQPGQPEFSPPLQPLPASSKDPDRHSGHGGTP